MPIKLHIDFFSQPSRSLFILLKKIKCDFELSYIDLIDGQHFTPEFKKLNPLQKVPVLDYNGFVIAESIAILRFLSQENIVPESLYPRDSRLQARCDEYLEWQHVGLRYHDYLFYRVGFIVPMVTGKQADPARYAKYKKNYLNALKNFDSLWMGKGTFILGEQITIADLWAACEIEQCRSIGVNAGDLYPKIGEWIGKVRAHFNPYYDEAHCLINEHAKKYEQDKVKPKL